MDSFDVWHIFEKKARAAHGALKKIKLSRISGKADYEYEFLRIFQNAETSIDIRMGEIFTFDDPEFAADARVLFHEKIDADPNFKIRVTCGGIIVCDRPILVKDAPIEYAQETHRNRFLDMLEEDFKGNEQVQVYFNRLEAVAQISLGYFHEVIIDGRHTFVESPSAYRQRNGRADLWHPIDDRDWLFVENDKDFADYVERVYRRYEVVAGVCKDQVAVWDLIRDNTDKWEDYCRVAELLEFADKFAFERRYRQWLNDGLDYQSAHQEKLNRPFVTQYDVAAKQ